MTLSLEHQERVLAHQTKIADAFRKLDGDALDRLVGFGRLEKFGLATSYLVGGRFVHLSLNEAGIEARDALKATGTI